MPLLLGIDIGTSGTKVIVMDEDGGIVASATEVYPLHTPRPNWAEQDPADWWAAAVGAIRRACERGGVEPADIGCVGLTGQMHGLVLLDEKDQVLRPAILWCDQRTMDECRWIIGAVGGAERLRELTCNPALTGFTAPKIVWVRDHEPDVYKKIRKVLLPKDYIRFMLTGEYATEVSDASGTLLFDVEDRRWSHDVLGALGVSEDWLPRCYESPEVTGRVTEAAARETGLAEGTPVVGGGGDQAAGAVGSGIVKPGAISVTVGTSGVVFAYMDEPALDAEGRLHTFCHAVPGKWHAMGVTLGAGGSMRWFRDALCEAEVAVARCAGTDPYEIITAEAAHAEPGCEGLVFLPYVAGERTPYPDPNARGVFFGLSLRHTKAHMARAVMEGVAFSLRDCLELVKALGVSIGELRVSGGGARSTLWRQIIADVFGSPLVTLEVTEGPAYGAALLAGVGAGVYRSVPEACERTIKPAGVTEPELSGVGLYEEYYGLYRDLYPRLKPEFDRAAEIVSRRSREH
ncbi:MAG: xylulokinase [Bacillota bacterium]|nr:xylulokinase [Bacillota bacterium]